MYKVDSNGDKYREVHLHTVVVLTPPMSKGKKTTMFTFFVPKVAMAADEFYKANPTVPIVKMFSLGTRPHRIYED
jgi:hypothetical protein